jgi:hypothetical protein
VWMGPENLIEKIPLASVRSYRNNPKLAYLFQDILNIKNSNWNDYIGALLQLKRTQNPPADNLHHKVKELYMLLKNCRLTDEEWELVM